MFKKIYNYVKEKILSITIRTVLKHLFVTTAMGFCLLFGMGYFILPIIYQEIHPIIYIYGYLLMTNFFDMLGYGEIMQPLYNQNRPLYDSSLPYYRILQKMNNIIFLAIVYLMSQSWITVAGAFAINIGGLQDLFYYIFRSIPLDETFTWMKWTPYSIFKRIFFKTSDLTKTEFIWQAIISGTLVVTLASHFFIIYK